MSKDSIGGPKGWPALDPNDEGAWRALGSNMGRFFPGSGNMAERNERLYQWMKGRVTTGFGPTL
jgi:hypothetical protein